MQHWHLANCIIIYLICVSGPRITLVHPCVSDAMGFDYQYTTTYDTFPTKPHISQTHVTVYRAYEQDCINKYLPVLCGRPINMHNFRAILSYL